MKKESQLGLENPKVVVVVGDGVEAVGDMRERERERERERASTMLLFLSILALIILKIRVPPAVG
jgi:hypothetical protein